MDDQCKCGAHMTSQEKHAYGSCENCWSTAPARSSYPTSSVAAKRIEKCLFYRKVTKKK